MPPSRRNPIGRPSEEPNNRKPNVSQPHRSMLTRPTDDTRRIVRPPFDTLESDQAYSVKIAEASVVTVGNSDRLRLGAEFSNPEGEVLLETLLLQPDWKVGSPFRELLEVTDLMPKPKQDLDIDALVGRELLMTVQINVKNGRSYTNLIKTEAIPDGFEDDSESSYPDEADDEDQYE